MDWNETAKQALVLLDKWKVSLTVTAITATGLCFAYSYVRPLRHDNIPMMDIPMHPLYGQTKNRKLNEMYGEFHEVNNKFLLSRPEPVISKSIPMRQHLVFLNDPAVVKFVFEDQFELFEKGKTIQEITGDIFGNGIFASDPPEWKVHRKVASRMFSMRNLKEYMFECAADGSKRVVNKLKELQERQKQLNDECAVVDISDILGRFTLDSFVKVCFGHSLELIESTPKLHPFSQSFDYLSEHAVSRLIDMVWKFKRILNIGSEALRKEHLEVIDKFVNGLLDLSTKSTLFDESGKTRHDLLSLYLQHNPNWTRKELRDVALNMIIAGRDTTRALLGWFFVCVSDRPDILKKIITEIDAVGARDITYDQVHNKLQYIYCVLLETLRLFPSVPSLARIAKQDVQLPVIGDEKVGYIIRKGDICTIHNYTLGRSTKFWGPNAAEFDPMRWSEHGLNTAPPHVFPHFNINPRLCLGRHFALMEAQIFVFYFFKNFRFRPLHSEKPKYTVGLILNLKGGYPIVLSDADKKEEMSA